MSLFRRNKKGRKGLTMMEMIGVALMVAIFAGMIGVSIFNNIKTGKVNAAAAQIKQLGEALELANALGGGSFPDSAPNTDPKTATKPDWYDGLVTLGYINDPRGDGWLDPWGQPYGYCQPSRSGEGIVGAVWSAGPNGDGKITGNSNTCPTTPGDPDPYTPADDTAKYNLYYFIRL